MTAIQWLLASGSRVNFQNVRDYLKASGWVVSHSTRTSVAIFRRPESIDHEVLVPLDRALADYPQAMARAASDIAVYEGRSASDVFRDLLRPRRDVLKFGLSGPETMAGTVSFEEGAHLIGGIRKALLASACSAKRPRRYHPRLSLGEADAYVRGCTLGQTEIGSFVVTVDTPLEIAGTIAMANDFGRRATMQLLQSAAILKQATLIGDLESLVSVDDDRAQVSANLCDAFLEIMPSDESADVVLRASWSPMLPLPPGVPSVVEIDRGAYGAIEELGNKLRPNDGPKPGQFVAYVAELSGGPNINEEMEGETTLMLWNEGEVLRVRVELKPDQYAVAANAHMHVKAVTIVGVLQRGRRSARISDVTDFRLTS